MDEGFCIVPEEEVVDSFEELIVSSVEACAVDLSGDFSTFLDLSHCGYEDRALDGRIGGGSSR